MVGPLWFYFFNLPIAFASLSKSLLTRSRASVKAFKAKSSFIIRFCGGAGGGGGFTAFFGGRGFDCFFIWHHPFYFF